MNHLIEQHLIKEPDKDDLEVLYHLPGAAITHDVYNHAQRLVNAHSIQRSRSFNDLNLKAGKIAHEDGEYDNLHKPGGFRRFHLQQSYGAIQPTRHFIDFLASTMNQFAGEDLSEAKLPTQKIGLSKTVFLLFKAFIGSGILFLPKAFSNGGLLFSVIVMWIMCGISLVCFLLLLDCKNHLNGSYGDIGGHLYGHKMRMIVLISIAISQMGFMCGGTIFIVQNIQEAVRSFSQNTIHLSSNSLFIGLSVVLIPLVLIRNISKLSFTAILSDILIIIGLGILIFYDFLQLFKTTPPTPGPGIEWTFNSNNFSVFIGTAVYSYEGIGLIIPIRDSMENPKRFPFILTCVMVLVACTLCLVGSLGYIAYGRHVETVALLNLPPGIIPNSIQLGYALAIFASTALTLYPTMRIIEQGLFGDLTGKYNLSIKWQKNLVRTLIVFLCTSIAWLGSNDLDKFISLIGSICCCPLSLIFPPLFHMRLPTTQGIYYKIDCGLVVFGIIVMFYTLLSTSTLWFHSG
ncbi:transmembrane amino acid transporter protein-domain-containing protein [Pilobolus umbonatus]|nr:transmembrane amino acid transporter protein-domain-containing protein [Pilobolus umbonatus]